MAFSNIENSEKLEIIDIAIVDNEEFQNNEIFKEALKNLSDEENADRLFDAKYITEDEAKDLLEKDEISGYIKIKENTPKIVVKSSGINQTILKYVTEEITQNSEIISNVIENEVTKEITHGNYNIDYEKIYKNALEITQNTESGIEDISSSNLSYTMIEFYTLIAMTCLYGGIFGIVAINQNLANMSSKGKRVSVSPNSKGKTVLSSLIAAYIVQLIGLTLLFVYTVFVLKVDYGTKLPLIILLGIIGSFAGLSMSIAVRKHIKS